MRRRCCRLVNSSLFGLQRSVASIERALTLLGLNHVRSLVLGLTLPSMRFRSRIQRADEGVLEELGDLRDRVPGVGVATQMARSGQRNGRGAVVRHGNFALAGDVPGANMPGVEGPPEMLDRSRCELEEKEIGVNHATAGVHCLRRWNLPEESDDADPVSSSSRTGAGVMPARANLLHFASQVARIHQSRSMPPCLGRSQPWPNRATA